MDEVELADQPKVGVRLHLEVALMPRILMRLNAQGDVKKIRKTGLWRGLPQVHWGANREAFGRYTFGWRTFKAGTNNNHEPAMAIKQPHMSRAACAVIKYQSLMNGAFKQAFGPRLLRAKGQEEFPIVEPLSTGRYPGFDNRPPDGALP